VKELKTPPTREKRENKLKHERNFFVSEITSAYNQKATRLDAARKGQETEFTTRRTANIEEIAISEDGELFLTHQRGGEGDRITRGKETIWENLIRKKSANCVLLTSREKKAIEKTREREGFEKGNRGAGKKNTSN